MKIGLCNFHYTLIQAKTKKNNAFKLTIHTVRAQNAFDHKQSQHQIDFTPFIITRNLKERITFKVNGIKKLMKIKFKSTKRRGFESSNL